ncbi:hypothetical protein B0H16DRAFT_542894 [Mycena metata]|uniref:Uncharacterized protein n=1 Tax=Mycena metata TaxID=1033252 RepID=A0AAD7H7M1_9AGAR|nr:hypothetical protein B0H16DRAFT_542894 [Mycena metata]
MRSRSAGVKKDRRARARAPSSRNKETRCELAFDTTHLPHQIRGPANEPRRRALRKLDAGSRTAPCSSSAASRPGPNAVPAAHTLAPACAAIVRNEHRRNHPHQTPFPLRLLFTKKRTTKQLTSQPPHTSRLAPRERRVTCAQSGHSRTKESSASASGMRRRRRRGRRRWWWW